MLENARTRRRTGTRAVAATLALLGAVATACGGGKSESAQPAAVTSFAAPVNGSDAFVGLVVDRNDNRVMAYVCDGSSLGSWFTGRAGADGSVSLTNTDGARLDGRMTGEQLSGTISLPGGGVQVFNSGAVSAPAGLYRLRGEVRGQPAVGGWVVLGDGRQRGGVRTSTGFIGSESDFARPPKPVASFTETVPET